MVFFVLQYALSRGVGLNLLLVGAAEKLYGSTSLHQSIGTPLSAKEVSSVGGRRL